jgi:1,4-dihydroxy-2-naphthoyl-CoA hydrolase
MSFAMAFTYHRTIRFADTDAAGVVFFPNYLAICHEAYEESLGADGITLQSLIGERDVVIPVSKSRAEYLRPLACGDKIRVTLASAQLGPDSFAIDFELHRLGPHEKLAARVRTEHVCIAARSRERHALPAGIAAWIGHHTSRPGDFTTSPVAQPHIEGAAPASPIAATSRHPPKKSSSAASP